MLRALLFASCVLAPTALQEPAADAAGPDVSWRELVLPRGFVLDLQRGLVSDRPTARGRPLLEWGEHGLTANVGLRFLDGLAPVGPRARVERDAGSVTVDLPPVAGVEAVFDCEEGGWGYLRVLRVEPSGCRLEYVFEAESTATVLERDPARLVIRSLPDGIELSWEGRGSGPLIIERRALDVGGEPGSWKEVAKAKGSTWTDPRAPRGASFEYRVRRAASSTGFGTSVLGVSGLAPQSEAVPLTRGARVDLVSCSQRSSRLDLRVEYVGPNGAQFSVGPLVRAHLLTPDEERLWSLPEPTGRNYESERIFVPAGKALAVITPEGFFARVTVEAVGEEEVLLRRQIDLAGGRTFLPPPPAPAVGWEAERGVVFEFPAAALECAAAQTASIVVESLGVEPGGAWGRCVRGGPGERELVDADPGAGGLARYRFRYALPDGTRSLPGPAVALLVGDDGGSGTAELVERAVADLAHPEFERRSLARDVLEAVGEPAIAPLREALASEDPELAAAARELLDIEGVGRSGGGEPKLTGEMLEAMARARGLGGPPSAGWSAAQTGARAMALLRDTLGTPPDGAAARETPEDWRALLAESDPQAGVRLLAILVGELAASPRGDARTVDLDVHSGAPDGLPGWDLAGLDVLSIDAARADLADRIDLADPWAVLVRLQVLRDLEREDPARVAEVTLAREIGAMRRALLAEALLARRAPNGSGVFTDAAMAVVSDPGARLRAGLDLADLRAARPPGSGAVDRETLRITEPSAAALFDVIADLEAEGLGDVDLFLPPGTYASETPNQTLRIAVDGLRIVGDGECSLLFGVTVLEGARVALEGLRIAPRSGTSLSVISADAALRDCLIDAPSVGIQSSAGVVELLRTTIVPSGANKNAGGVRMSGASLLLARESRIESGIGALFGARAALLERCVVIGVQRGGIVGAAGGELWLVDSYVEASTQAISKVARGVIEGSVLVGGSGAGGGLGAELSVCPDHLRFAGSPGDFSGEHQLARCPLGR
ncbi:MAG: hypothetical protein QF903_08790 [Planctomycetota bacterium]|jgi:hypothetical protein|nr:hypothetical protein [Planctomycetota bacterium]MDP6763188.1 hypothetical protein [Planctomycetota bacterium]MDP6989560.1 hypothetical protein [Planctomycetota bacterium]